jgi:hypothetical protein
MFAVRDWVMVNLDVLTFIEIADYIDSHIVKLPVIRRTWLLG